MSTSANSAQPLAVDVQVSTSTLEVMLADGRTISAPLSWFPRLENGTADERARWQLIGGGEGIHWLDLDEDISVEALLEGRGSSEARASIEKWLAQRSG